MNMENDTTPKSLEMQKSDYDKVIRKLIEKETDIVDTRIRWSFIMHGVLFTAYWNVLGSNLENQCWYIGIIIVIGVCFAMSSVYSVWSSERAIAFILSKWDKYLLDNRLSSGDFPPVWVGSKDAINNVEETSSKFKKWLYKNVCFRMGFMSMYNIIPRIFLLAWIVIAILYFLF